MPVYGKTMKGDKKVFFRVAPNGDRIEVKKTKDGWKDGDILPAKTDTEKKRDKLSLQIKAAEIRGDKERLDELKEKLDELE